jgi:hypothetical protein
MDLNYYETLIAVADDCPVSSSEVPVPRGGKATAAVVQYTMLSTDPYRHTQEDVLFESWLARQEGTAEKTPDEVERLRHEFFAKPQPCLRSSPLPKKYGWGLRFDRQGRVALLPRESAEYSKIIAGEAGPVKILKALRSSRA